MHFRLLRILLIITLFLASLIIAISFLVKTDYVQQKALSFVNTSLRKYTGQEVKIDSVNFDVIEGVVIKNVIYEINNDDFLQIKSITIGYPFNIFSLINALINKDINIERLEISGLNLHLKKDSGDKWNYRELVKGNAATNGNRKSNQASNFDWNIKINNAKILQTNIYIADDPENEDKHILINKLEFSFNLDAKDKNINFNIKDGSIVLNPFGLYFDKLLSSIEIGNNKKIVDIEFNINDAPASFYGELSGNEEKSFLIKSYFEQVKITNAILNGELKGSGKYKTLKDIDGNFSLEIKSSEILGNKFDFIAQDINIRESHLTMSEAILESDFGKIKLSFDLGLKSIFDNKRNNNFNLDLKISDFYVSKILDIDHQIKTESMPENDILLNMGLKLSGFFNNSEDFNINAALDELSVTGLTGQADLNGSILFTDILMKPKLAGKLRKFNLEYLTGSRNYRSLLNANFDIDCEIPLDLNLQKTSGYLDIKLLSSNIFNRNIQSGEIYAKVSPGSIEEADIKISSDFLNIDISGSSNKDQINFEYNIESKDLSFISDFKPELTLKGILNAKGVISGSFKEPKANYFIQVQGFEYKDLVSSESIKMRGELVFEDSFLNISSNGNAYNFGFKNNTFENVDINISTMDREILFEIFAKRNETNFYNLNFKIADIKNKDVINVSKVSLNIEKSKFDNREPFEIDFSDGLKIVGFNIYKESTSILADIEFNRGNRIHSSISFKNLELIDISKLFQLQEPISGLINGKIYLSGTNTVPVIDLNVEISDLIYRDFKTQIISIKSSYMRNNFSIDILSKNDNNEDIILKGLVNTKLNLNNIKSSINGSSFNIVLKSTNLDLSPFSRPIEFIDELEGGLILDISLKGTPDAPLIYGNIIFNRVNVLLSSIKNTLNLSEGQIVFDGNRAKLLNINVLGGNGYAELNGNVSNIYLPQAQDLNCLYQQLIHLEKNHHQQYF